MSEWAAKRFWKEVGVTDTEAGFGVALDGRPVKTPSKTPLAVPSRPLAEAIAEEWNAQGEKIDPNAMPLTRAANSALDKVTPQRVAVAEMLSEYGGTDLLCYRADSPHTLVARQAAAWDPLLDWAREAFDAPLAVRAGVMHIAQPEDSLRNLREQVVALDAFELTGFHDLVTISGSLVIALAVLRGHAAAEDLWPVSRIDEDFQIEQWGKDEEAAEMAEAKRRDFLNAHRFIVLHRAE